MADLGSKRILKKAISSPVVKIIKNNVITISCKDKPFLEIIQYILCLNLIVIIPSKSHLIIYTMWVII
ncbi:MAG: hypothetical protein PWQ37_2283 [Candidatus Petromonas sp.]|jgi:hypothetical protein|nr:hypothetical protein [Candidatus Petromonas sp.]